MSTTSNPEITPEMMAQFAAMQAGIQTQTVAPVLDIAPVAAPVAPVGVTAPVTNPAVLDMPTMPAMDLGIATTTPAINVVPNGAPEMVTTAPAITTAPVVTQETAPVVNQVVTPEISAVAPVVTQAQTIAPVVTQTAAPVMDGNGIDLDGIMSPEEVNLTQKEVEAKPISINGLSNIGSCKTSVWGAFIKITEFIAKDLGNNDIIVIDNGTIDTNKEGVFIHCDMQNILGNISLNITAPDSSVKLLKLIRGGDLVQIFREDTTNSYVFCNISGDKVLTRVKTKLAADASVNGFGKTPLLGTPIRQKEISNADKEIIKTIIAGKSAIGSDEPYRFGFSTVDASLVSIGVGKDFTHFFQDSGIATVEYRVYNPFPVPNMDSCIIKIYDDANDTKKKWIQTVSNIEISSIVCTECVEIIDTAIEDYSFN